MTIDKSMIILPLESDTKAKALEALCRRVASVHGLDEKKILDAVNEREKLGSTAIGHWVAIPHCRLDGLGGVYTALGVSQRPIEYDDQSVRILFLVVSDKALPSEQVRTLSQIASFCNSDVCRRLLLDAKSPEQASSLIED
ncbi:MAG: PTS sugar transporter subunit IIA [Sphaerochaetaceae bacterium]|jgi:PTS system nitrogen regulatory IIA component|nr:PTS sugar transporter subunit IIA [Sphaerochaetaceae bacterium]